MPLTHVQELEIAGALAEVDPAQISVFQRLTTAQRAQQGLSLIRTAEQAVAYQLRVRQPELTPGMSLGLARKALANRGEATVVDPNMEFGNFVRDVLDALEKVDVTYLVGGAVATWGWGEARTTRDCDVVVDLPVERMGLPPHLLWRAS